LILDVPYNFHWIERGVAARAAQAYAGFLGPFLSAHGIRAILNLRGSNPDFLWWRYETRVCARLDIAHRDAKFNSRQLPTQAMLVQLLDAFDSLPEPLLLKCSGGQDRTSFAAALHVLHRHGWQAFEQAQAQFAVWPYLHRPHRQQRWLKLFPVFARDEAAGRSLSQWIQKDYAASAFRDWLEARGEARAFRGLYGVGATADRQ
jgi:protein tyrosine/serine phosphatase